MTQPDARDVAGCRVIHGSGVVVITAQRGAAKIVLAGQPFYDGVMLSLPRWMVRGWTLVALAVLSSFVVSCSSAEVGQHVQIIDLQGEVTYVEGSAPPRPVRPEAQFDAKAGGRFVIPAGGDLLVYVQENQRVAYLRPGEVALGELFVLEQPAATKTIEEQAAALSAAQAGSGARSERVAAFQAGVTSAETIGVASREAAPSAAEAAETASDEEAAQSAQAAPSSKDRPTAQPSGGGSAGPAPHAPEPSHQAAPPPSTRRAAAPEKSRKLAADKASAPHAVEAPARPFAVTPKEEAAERLEVGGPPSRGVAAGQAAGDGAEAKKSGALQSTAPEIARVKLPGGVLVAVRGGSPALRTRLIDGLEVTSKAVLACGQLKKLKAGPVTVTLRVNARGVRQVPGKPTCLEKALWGLLGKAPANTQIDVTFQRDPRTLRKRKGH